MEERRVGQIWTWDRLIDYEIVHIDKDGHTHIQWVDEKSAFKYKYTYWEVDGVKGRWKLKAEAAQPEAEVLEMTEVIEI